MKVLTLKDLNTSMVILSIFWIGVVGGLKFPLELCISISINFLVITILYSFFKGVYDGKKYK